MLSIIHKLADAGHRKVFRDRSGHHRGRDQRKRHRTEILFEVPEQRLAHRFAVHHPTRNEGAGHPPVWGAAQQQTHLGDATDPVNPNRNRLNVDHGQASANLLELIVAQPAGVWVRSAHAHTPILPDDGPGLASSYTRAANYTEGVTNDVRIDPTLVQWNVAEAERTEALQSRPLLVLLHGYGSFEGDLISLAPMLPGEFVCASPRAPIDLPPPIVNGFGWYEITQPGQPDVPALVKSTEAVFAWLDDLDTEVLGGLGTVALMGFSQGGCMVTMLMRHRPDRFAAGVVCSGFIAEMQAPGDAALASIRPPVFWGRDVHDPIIADHLIPPTEAWLRAHTDLTERTYPGIAHSISREEMHDIATFFEQHVPEVRG